MTMVKVKTAELTGRALDWAVAQVVKPEGFVMRDTGGEMDPPMVLGIADIPDARACLILDINPAEINIDEWPLKSCWSPSTDWSQAGPLMEKYEISVIREEGIGSPSFWAGTEPLPDSMFGFNYKGASESGETILIAVCRTIVTAKLGGEVEVPQELVGVDHD
ncbi:phage protein NinX family protein [Klebsiella pneumoniae]|uniref:phage protein NinX family protein n=1 Tax=Klebsiella pneumoniae TaxID=573 RepID=UPI0034D17113